MSAKLKVFTFNLRINNKGDGINMFDNRTDRILECINTYKPDLIGFQEGNAHMRAFLRDHLEDYTVVGCGREKDYHGESAAIAFKKDAFELISLDTFWLSAQPHVPGSRYGGDQSSCPRVCTSAFLKHNDCEKPFWFYNTHLDHQGKTARLLGSVQLMQYLSEKPYKFVLTGDFNARPDTASIRMICNTAEQLGTVDATQHIKGTFHGFRGDCEDRKIDYIFTNLAVDPTQSYDIPDDDSCGHYYSDHHAVCAFVTLD